MKLVRALWFYKKLNDAIIGSSQNILGEWLLNPQNILIYYLNAFDK